MSSKRTTCGLDEAIRDIRLGRVNKYDSSNALFKKLGLKIGDSALMIEKEFRASKKVKTLRFSL